MKEEEKIDKDVYWEIRKFIKNSPIYYNSSFFDDIEIDDFIKKYFTSEGWRFLSAHVYPYNKRVFVSKSAIMISNKTKKQLQIELIPVVIPVARKGFDMSGGTYPFMMYDKKGKNWCFDIPVHIVHRKSTKLELFDENYDTIITGEY